MTTATLIRPIVQPAPTAVQTFAELKLEPETFAELELEPEPGTFGALELEMTFADLSL